MLLLAAFPSQPKHSHLPKPFGCSRMKAIMMFFLVLISALGCVTNAARILDDLVDPQPPLDTTVPPLFPQAPTLPPADVPAIGTPLPAGPADVVPPVLTAPEVGAPLPAGSADVVPPVLTAPAIGAPLPAAAADAPEAVPAATVGPTDGPVLSFFMHDVLGGSQASGRVVTGIVATSGSSNIPFSKPNNQVFPVSGGVPLFNNQINNIVNNNNAPVLAAMNSQQLQQQSSTVIQNAGTANSVVNGGNSQPFVTAGQLPQGASLQELMFGSITVIDDQITEGHELGSAVLGSAQGFYLASSLDGQSHTMAWTVCFTGDHDGDTTISFFGVHRPASPLSYVAIIGGNGKYENAKGYASIEALPQVDQYTTDGVETILHISVYFS